MANLVSSPIAYGIAKAPHDKIHVYQSIYRELFLHSFNVSYI